jgi:hypothetical protein
MTPKGEIRRRPLLLLLFATAIFVIASAGAVVIWRFESVLQSIDVEDSWGSLVPEVDFVSKQAVPVWYQMDQFDAEKQRARVITYVWPSADIATPYLSSTVANVPIRAFIDEIGNRGFYEYASGERIGGVPAEIDAVNPLELSRSLDSWYPFDQYSLALFTNVEADLIEDGITTHKAVPTFDFFYETPIPGFHVTYTRTAHDSKEPKTFFFDEQRVIEDRMLGSSSVIAKIRRTFAVRIIAGIVSLFTILAAVSLFGMALQVYLKRRPPSVQALVWAAATVLALVQLRDLLPGRPRIGIMLDFFVFFPALVASLISVSVLAVLWERRDDYAL